jgi:hypothetical protein
MSRTGLRFAKDWHHLSHTLGYSNKHEMLEDLYLNQHLSLHQIAERLDCSPHCVGRNLAREQIDRRSRGGKNNPSNQTHKLFLLDQRVVLNGDFIITAKHCFVSTSLLYHYRKLMKEGTWTSAS